MSGFGAHVCYHCRISPPRFLAECRKRRLNQGSFVLLYFNSSALFDLYLVFACLFSCTVCLFSCTALFVSISQVIGCEDRLRNDLYCVGWGVKLYSLTHSLFCFSVLSRNMRYAKSRGENVWGFPQHIFIGSMPFLSPNQQRQSTE